MTVKNAKPFIKWAGGKRQLLEQYSLMLPEELKQGRIKRYIESFLGGGAMFFYMIENYDFEEIVLNDVNEELILTYKIIQSNVDKLILNLKDLEDLYFNHETLEEKEKFFYSVRDKFNKSKTHNNFNDNILKATEHASYFIFLNKTCFNGIYRENSKGLFNVPFGKHKNPTILEEENLINVSRALQGVTLLSVDFENLEEYIKEDSFVYFDPPYRPLTKTASFESYIKGGFGDAGQERLASFFKNIHQSGNNIKLMLSNSNPKNSDPEDDFFVNLYSGEDISINEVLASRAINSKASGRGKISELLITNYQI